MKQSFINASRTAFRANGGSNAGNSNHRPQSSDLGAPVNWNLLKVRLENLCPSKQSISTLSSLNLAAYVPGQNANDANASSNPNSSHFTNVNEPKPGTMYILQVEVEDRVGLLHDVTQELWASELTVHLSLIHI